MDLMHGLLLLFTAWIAGAINSVVGGGTFLLFPVLLLTGINPVVANASCTIALWPGSIAGAYGYRRELNLRDSALRLLVFISLIGGTAGALTLLFTPAPVFEHLIPWLLFGATMLFACSKSITRFFRQHTSGISSSQPWLGKIFVPLLQFTIAFYGGYFGAGIGILMLALLGLMGYTAIHAMNGTKALLATAINGVSVIIFVLGGAIAWPQAMVMLVGAVAGGFMGAHYSQKLPEAFVRQLVLAVAVMMTIYFFFKTYG